MNAGGGPPMPPLQRCVDLHMHSTASDGTCAPEDVVAAAVAAGLSAIALTDHDTLDGIARARTASEGTGMRIVAGVELSSVDGDRETHILGLHLARTEEMERQLLSLREARWQRARDIVARLNFLGIPVTIESVRAEVGRGAAGRPHIARALMRGGWVLDQREAFDRYLGAGKPAFVPKEKLSAAEAITMIRQTGGLAILAHPGAEGRRALIEPLVKAGLDGLEVRHPSHSVEDIRRLAAMVDHFGLVPSGGSDWHGATEGPRTIGCMGVPITWLERQDERVVRRAAERVA